jgi:U4/U6.U5 tri-snRNP component SNU23
MADGKGNAYGGTSKGDTAFRRTWDTAEYAERAAAREAKEREEGKARYEAKLAGKKYHRRASTPPDAKDTTARTQRLDVGSMVGKTMLVPAGAAVGKRGRGAGFYCEACDLTFKDNLQLVEHYNSKQHQAAMGETGEVRRASVKEVRERLRWLKRKIEEEKRDEVVDLSVRLEVARERIEEEREERRQKRNEKRRKTKDGMGVKQEEVEGNGVIR